MPTVYPYFHRRRPAPAAAGGGWLHRLHTLLTRPIRLERRGLQLRLVLTPAAPQARDVRHAARPRERSRTLPSMPSGQFSLARLELRALLDHTPGGRRARPSLALLERALSAGRADALHRLQACVLRHAAQSLDQLDHDRYGPGLIALRRHVELVLRRRHGHPPSHWAWLPGPPERERRASPFSDSLTEFMDLDHHPARERPARVAEGVQRMSGSMRATNR